MTQGSILVQLLKALLAVLLIAGAAGALVYTYKRHQRKKEEKKEHDDLLRIQVLNQSLKNNMRREAASPLRPADCRPGDEEKKAMLRLMIESISRNRHDACREYVLNPEEHVIIGSQSDCHIQLEGREIANRQCEFFTYGGNIYVKNLNPLNNTSLQRKSKTARVDNTGIKVCTGDKIIAGPYSMRADILDITGRPVTE